MSDKPRQRPVPGVEDTKSSRFLAFWDYVEAKGTPAEQPARLAWYAARRREHLAHGIPDHYLDPVTGEATIPPLTCCYCWQSVPPWMVVIDWWNGRSYCHHPLCRAAVEAANALANAGAARSRSDHEQAQRWTAEVPRVQRWVDWPADRQPWDGPGRLGSVGRPRHRDPLPLPLPARSAGRDRPP